MIANAGWPCIDRLDNVGMSKDAQRNAASSSGIAEYAQDPDKAVRVAVQTAGFGGILDPAFAIDWLTRGIAATLGGVYGAAAAFFRHAPTVPVALASGINFGTTAFIFFCRNSCFTDSTNN